MRLRELAASRVRFGYRRLTVMLRREGWRVNAKRIYRLYTEEGLAVRTKVRKKIARRMRSRWLRQHGRTKSGKWILSPPGSLMGAGFEY